VGSDDEGSIARRVPPKVAVAADREQEVRVPGHDNGPYQPGGGVKEEEEEGSPNCAIRHGDSQH
jgi:hypothetical protein